MKTITLVGAALAALLSGCATDPEIAKLAMQRQPTLKVTCPVGGCDIEYRDPRDQVRLPTNGYDAAIAISGQVTGLVGGAVVPAAMGAVAVQGFQALRGSGPVTTTITTTTDNHSATATPTVVQQPAPVIVPPADPVIVQQPAPVIVPPADPVIVEQPAPVIVQQPAPVVVQGAQ